MLLHTTNSVSIDDFALDDDVALPLLPVGVDEARVVDCSDPSINRAYIVDRNTGERREVLPPHLKPGEWKQLVISLDSGGIGRAGGSFAKHAVHTNIFMSYDKIHRIVRDCKLAAEHSQNGDVYRGILQMSFVWSLHSKPFGSGAWRWELEAALEDFLRWEEPSGELFRHFAPLWAQDLGMHCYTEDDMSAMWDMLPDLWITKEAAPKMMRWFSFNQAFHERASWFWPTKMILTHHLRRTQPEVGTMEDPAHVMQRDPRKELQALKASMGGLALAEKLLNPWLHFAIRVYYYGTKASWTWYTEQRTRVKNCDASLRFLLKASRGAWQQVVQNTFHDCLYTQAHLGSMALLDCSSPADHAVQQARAEVVLDFAILLSRNLVSSFFQYEAPPYSYAGVFSSSPSSKAEAMDRMKRDANAMYLVESLVHKHPSLRRLVDDVKDVICLPVRICWAAFERDKYNSLSTCGRRHLTTMLNALPDASVVEDQHQHLRDLQRQQRSYVSSKVRRYAACIDSGSVTCGNVNDSNVFFPSLAPTIRHEIRVLSRRTSP